MNARPEASPGFPAGDSATSDLMRAHDWSLSPLGPPEGWPAMLRAAVALILDSGFAMCIAWGEELALLYNDSYAAILGDKHPAALGRPAPEVWADVWPLAGPLAAQALAGQLVHLADQKLQVERNGQADRAWFTFSYSPVRDESGQIRGLYCVSTETTASVLSHKRQAFRIEYEDRLRYAASPEAVMQLTAEMLGPYLRANRAGIVEVEGDGNTLVFHQDWTDGQAPSLAGLRFSMDNFRTELIGELRAGRTVVTTDAQQYGFTGGPDGGPYANIHARAGITVPLIRGGQFTAALYVHSSTPRRWREDERMLVREIAERAWDAIKRSRAEQKLQKALYQTEDALRQAQKMEAVGQLAGGIAHDFNNLLATMVANLEVMKMKITMGDTAGLERYVEGALGVADRAGALTHRLLAFSRRQTLDPKPVNVNRLVASMTDMIQRAVGPSVELSAALDAGIWTTRCDPNQLESALLNLAVNARDAMPEGGSLRIETRNAAVDETAAARQSGIAPGDYVEIRVIDNGTGMSPEVAARAFDPFFTTKPQGQGTGLGLSMIYGFVTQSGGHVGIESEPGNGTAVCIMLPRTMQAEPERDASRDAGSIGAVQARGELLLVDDEAELRGVLAEMLELLGYRVLQAADASQALQLAASHAGIEMLVTDIGLSGGTNGRQLAAKVQALRPGLKILLITGYVGDDASRNVPLDPGMQVMVKPFTLDAFAARIREMLGDTAVDDDGNSQR